MIVRHVLVDPDYFILVETTENDTMIVHEKIPLPELSTRVDPSDPRRLMVNSACVLYFDSANKCAYVGNMLELNR